MREPEIYDKLDGIFKELFLRDDIVLTPQLSAADVKGWDSFQQFNLIVMVEEQFNIAFNTRDHDGLKNIGDLVKIIETKLTAA
jgi:acyl carrier protein